MKPEIIVVQEDAISGELFLEFPDHVLKQAGLAPGDTIDWSIREDGSVVISKAEPAPETELVLVDAITMYRMRYVVEVPKGKAEWALDTVTCQEAEEFSQKHLEEVISSHRVISKEEFITLFNKDNDYLASMDDEQKLRRFITKIKT